MQQQRTLVTTIIYTVLSLLGVIALFLAYGLKFQHDATIRVLLYSSWIVGVALIVIAICVFAPKIDRYRQEKRMRDEEYKKSQLERRRIHVETESMRKDIEAKERDIEAKDFDLTARKQRHAIELEAMLTRLNIERQQSAILQVPSSNSLWQIQDGEFVKIAEAQPRGIAASQIQTPLQLPGHINAIDVMKTFDLRPDNFFLALGKGNQQITCSLKGFMHAAHDASTGGGKTSQQRLEIVQHIKLGVYVILAFPHFLPLTEDGEDWRPIGRAIEHQGMLQVAPDAKLPGLIRKPQSILKVLEWLSTSEIGRRIDMASACDFSYPPIMMFIDELPYLTRVCPEIATYLVDVIQRGRFLKIRVDVSAQSFLVNTVKMSGDTRENFNTAYYMGGSDHSGSVLLDMPQKDMKPLLQKEQVVLGKGIALLRNNESEAVKNAQLVRLPYADNDFLYYMLGHADDWVMPYMRGKQTRQTEPQTDSVQVPTMAYVEGTVSYPQLEPAFHKTERTQRQKDLLTVYKAVQMTGTMNRQAIAKHTGISVGKVQGLITELVQGGYFS